MKCPMCDGPAMKQVRPAVYRRGSKRLVVATDVYRCAGKCLDDDGRSAFGFLNGKLMRANDKAAQKAWKIEFGEHMPMRFA